MRDGSNWRRAAFALATVAVAAVPAAAQITIDGTADAAYGAALSIQNTNTQFGNNTNPDPIVSSGGSEINQVFAVVANGRLYVTITGNLEANFNKMEVYIDSKSGGFNTINGASLVTQVDGYCCNLNGGDPPNLPDPNSGALQRQNGLTFDAGFEADYYLTFSRGGENTGPSLGYEDGVGFYAITAHYADLQGGTQQALGMQLAYNGLPNVLRGPLGPDFNGDKLVGGDDFLAWQRGFDQFDGTTTFATKADGDSNGDSLVDATDLANWQGDYGRSPQLGDYAFNPYNGGPSSESLLGPALPGLSQGQLIDQAYATTLGTDGDTGQLLARELAFVLPPDLVNDPDNNSNRRDMLNTVGLELAYNDSNVAGVSGDSPYTTPTAGDPENVTTGLEFSIPLSAIGSPGSSDVIRIFAFINGGGHDYASNQVSGDGILDGNLGGNGFGGFTGDLSGVNMNDFAGNQFVSLAVPGLPTLASVPEPGSIVLIGLAIGLTGYARRRA
ncbi:MAG: PEP-CTERM sorting domain-containing protein [Pirellulales bacterium]|nr:PEP-CTERM sorting domain-containing protein [Pirellulales bacterium]